MDHPMGDTDLKANATSPMKPPLIAHQAYPQPLAPGAISTVYLHVFIDAYSLFHEIENFLSSKFLILI